MLSQPSNALRQALELAAGPDSVSSDTAGYAVNGSRPDLVVTPASLNALSSVMAAARANNAAVAPWGGGTRMVLGNAISRLDLAVDLRGLNRVVRHTPADLTATVEAGIALTSLQRTLGDQGQFVALDPPIPQRATVGGTLAVGTSGPMKWLYGNPRDVVIGMKLVQADGKIVKTGGQVVKNVSGYDMSRLHIGALGTLGIIAEVSFKLTPLPHSESTVIASFGSRRDRDRAALSIFHSYVTPLALTAFDDGVSRRIEAPTMAASFLLAIRLGGRPLALERQVRECTSLCVEHASVETSDLAGAEADALWRRLADFGWDDGTGPAMAARAFLQPTKLAEVEEALADSAGNDELLLAAMSHPAHGTLLLHWFQGEGDIAGDTYGDQLHHARNAVHSAGGRLVIEQCASELKSRFDVWDEVGGPIEVMRRMKDQYDPKGILNPGRFVGRI